MLSLVSPVTAALGRLLDQILPSPCLLCGQADPSYRLLCPECACALPRLSQLRHLCQCCALPMESDAPVCGKCLHKAPAFSRASIVFNYVHPLDTLIHQFKYRRQLSSGKLLARLLADHLQAEPASTDQGAQGQPDFLVPVPMHWRKRWQRGFNQSELLAYWVAERVQIPVLHACRQKRHHHSQKGLGRRERLRNQRQVFEVIPAAMPHLSGKHVALVDDVVTTTATARALSELLIKAGARQVDIWALARTPDHDHCAGGAINAATATEK